MLRVIRSLASLSKQTPCSYTSLIKGRTAERTLTKSPLFTPIDAALLRSFSAESYGKPRSENNDILEDLFLGLADRKNFDYNKYKQAAVEVKGKDVPPPMTTWKEMNLPRSVQNNIDEAGFAEPILVQQYAIPVLTAKKDAMICAQTGSGKTAAFLLPIISQLQQNITNPFTRESGYIQFKPLAVILAPTRELAQQIQSEAVQFCRGTGVSSACVFGGDAVINQLQQMKRNPPHILIATPGRLSDMIERSYVSLEKVQSLVLDEADRMLDMGFEPQIQKIVEQSEMPDKNSRNTTMFSATFPREIRDLASRYLRNDYAFLSMGRVGGTAELVDQHFIKVDHPAHRAQHLLDLLKNSNREATIIFAQTKRDVEGLSFQLDSAGIRCTIIHGDRTQSQRNNALNSFARGSVPVLIATNVAARGIDFKGIKHVVNYDLPQDMDDYVHRIGRTGRAGQRGKATTFVSSTDSDSSIRKLEQILRDAKQQVPEWMALVSGARDMDYRGGRSRGGSSSFGGRGRREIEGFGAPSRGGRGGDSSFGSPRGRFDRGDSFGVPKRGDREEFGAPRGGSRNRDSGSSRKSSNDDFDWSVFGK